MGIWRRRVDPVLAVRLERALGVAAASFARQRAELFELDARVLHLRTGVVAVDSGTGGGESSSAVFGLGLDGPVTLDSAAPVHRAVADVGGIRRRRAARSSSPTAWASCSPACVAPSTAVAGCSRRWCARACGAPRRRVSTSWRR